MPESYLDFFNNLSGEDFNYVVPQSLEEQLSLCASLSSFGKQNVSDKSYYWDGTKRGKEQFVVIQYTLTGEGALTFENQDYELLPGTIMAVPIPHKHIYHFPEHSENWSFCYCCLRGSEVMRITRLINKLTGPVFNISEQSGVLGNIKKLFQLKPSENILSAFHISKIAYEIMMHLLEESTPLYAHNEMSLTMRNVCSYCHQNFHENLSLDDLAQHAGLSRFHFNRKFKEEVGSSPMDYLNRLRIDIAIERLRTTRWSIKEIALSCGFSDANYFAKVFRKRLGCNPGSFRDSN